MGSHVRSSHAGGAETPSAGESRALLRKLRDLNLYATVPGSPGETALRLEGCLSLDRPVEESVRYAVRRGGERAELDLLMREGALELVLEGPDGQELVRRRHALVRGAGGGLGVLGVAELAGENAGREVLEGFLVALAGTLSTRVAG